MGETTPWERSVAQRPTLCLRVGGWDGERDGERQRRGGFDEERVDGVSLVDATERRRGDEDGDRSGRRGDNDFVG